jgi:AbrB family looped-hinge helix DNA binding protein
MNIPAQRVRMSTKGQIVIPLAVRQKMGLKAGDSLFVLGGEEEVVLLTARRYAERLRGSAKGVYGRTREEVATYLAGERREWRR